MWEISGVRDSGVGKEAVVEEGTFEDEVREGVKDVPDVDQTEV